MTPTNGLPDMSKVTGTKKHLEAMMRAFEEVHGEKGLLFVLDEMLDYLSSRRDNELRVEFLGASVRTEIAVTYIVAAVAGGIGGVISGAAIGHVDPEYAYWTTSGEFVFVAILSGYFSIPAVFLGSIMLEIVRSFSNLYFPNTWQMSLGIFLLIVILLFPKGLGSLLSRTKKQEQL